MPESEFLPSMTDEDTLADRTEQFYGTRASQSHLLVVAKMLLTARV